MVASVRDSERLDEGQEEFGSMGYLTGNQKRNGFHTNTVGVLSDLAVTLHEEITF